MKGFFQDIKDGLPMPPGALTSNFVTYENIGAKFDESGFVVEAGESVCVINGRKYRYVTMKEKGEE